MITTPRETNPPPKTALAARAAQKRYSLYLFRRCLAYFKPYKLRILLAFVGMAAAAAAEAGTAWLIKPVMDGLFIGKNPSYLLIMPVFFVLINIAKGGGRLTQNYMMQSCGLKVIERLRDELYNKIVKLPVGFYEKAQTGMLMSRILNDVGQIRSSLPAGVMIVRQLLTMLALLAMIYYQIWDLALLATLALPLAVLPFIYYSRKLRKIGRKSQEVAADATSVLQEILSGIRVIKAFSTEKHEGVRFDQENKRIYKFALRRVLASESSSAIMEVVGAIGIGLVIYFGGHKVIAGEITPGTFASFAAALALLYEPLKKLNLANNDIQGALASAERVFEILDSPDIVEEQGGEREMSHELRDVELRDVVFSYGADAPALNHINLVIRHGERLALVGPSGAGKSTFVNLLPRFYDPTSGAALINGINVRDYSLHSLRAGIAIVSQDNFLFNRSIRDNIAYGRPDLDDETVEAAARAAYAHDFIMDMPQGYATVVGERGIKLSGGQKQRLTIARAIAKDAPLLILDEATSALDSESEKIVQKALENLMRGRTSIVIAHRLSTILNSDRILVMSKGEIVAQGRHRELLETSPLYARLYEMQFGEPG